jgi:putative aldouronate transport system permease protein
MQAAPTEAQIDTRLHSRKHQLAVNIKKAAPLYILLIPSFILVILFSYLPMGGIVMAFQDYKPWLGILHSPWVGMQNFQQIFQFDDSRQAIINTVIISTGKIILGIDYCSSLYGVAVERSTQHRHQTGHSNVGLFA